MKAKLYLYVYGGMQGQPTDGYSNTDDQRNIESLWIMIGICTFGNLTVLFQMRKRFIVKLWNREGILYREIMYLVNTIYLILWLFYKKNINIQIYQI